MSPEEVYWLQGLDKVYGGRTVLHIPDLVIERGQILAVIGPSGAGKSTLLRLLNFLEPPTNGRIRFLGQDFQGEGQVPLALRRRVTTVFQSPVLLNRSVAANVAYGLRLRGERRTETQVLNILESVGLADFAHQPARSLSGGEAQRVALARAMLLKPDVLLLDEPTANLDPYNVKLIEKAVEQLNREQGTTIILVTHNVFQARRLAHQAVLLIDGRVAYAGGIEEFFETSEHPEVQAFISGEMVY